MCGLAAFFAQGRQFSQTFLSHVDRDLFHRGPDAGGVLNEDGFALVFRRLSILDPTSRADQPMVDAETGTALVFNGEIYNFQELRHELAELGAQFRTLGDTETILVGYRYWGAGVFERLEGMFAIVLVDHKQGEAFGVRDSYGIKPLYLTVAQDVVGFASEVRPLLRLCPPKVTDKTIGELTLFGWASGTNSNYEGIERVLPGCIVRVDLSDNRVRRQRFCDPLDSLAVPKQEAWSFADAVEQAQQAIRASIKSHMISDVGYSLQLSGGVDSSVIAALVAEAEAGKIVSFGADIGEDQKHNEKAWRSMVVDRYNLDHTEISLGNAEYADVLPRAVRHMEGPLPHSADAMLMLICDQAKENSKVILTGEGADEFFGGYERYALWKKTNIQNRLAQIIPRALLPQRPPFLGVRRLSGRDAAVYSSVYLDLERLHSTFPELVVETGIRGDASQRFSSLIEKIFAVDRVAYLESLLVRQDKMSMASSVEARVPFVHRPLARVVDVIPRRVLSPGGVTKTVLKAVARRYLPAALVDRRKVGFLIDYDAWMRNEKNLGRYLAWLEDPNCRLSTYLSAQTLKRVVDEFRRTGSSRNVPLTRLISTEAWLRSFDDVGETIAAANIFRH